MYVKTRRKSMIMGRSDQERLSFSQDYINLSSWKIPTHLPNSCNRYMSTFQNQRGNQTLSKFAIFCESSSIRGMQKIHKSKSLFLKSLWIGFVFLMSILLIVISTYLVLDFRNYHTAWHISTELDEKTTFPAISICSHNPFSTEANDLWRKGVVLSPEDFRKRLFEAEVNLVKYGNLPGISLLDGADEYYGNIDYLSSIKLGHKRQILKYCVIQNDGFTIIAENCLVENETGFTVTQFSHYNYFNCFTVEAKSQRNGFHNSSDETVDTVSLILLINVNSFSDLYQADESFVMDSLTRGEGLRIVIHQVGSYPDIDKNGINIQPGKMNEVTFQNVHWKGYSSPKRECRDNQSPIIDLEKVYDYTFIQCLDAAVNVELIHKCKCMSTIWPRPQSPSKKIPYCNDYSGNLTKVNQRLDCVRDIYMNLKSIKAAAVGTRCWPTCSWTTYDTTLSVTRWKPSLNKLTRITRRYRSVNNYLSKFEKVEHNATLLSILKSNYFAELEKDLNYQPKTREILKEHQMNYVNLVRKNFNTIKKIEKLFIDIYIFISRVGGLCSLCIGLTTAFFVEIIEFIYLCSFYQGYQSKPETKDCQNDDSDFSTPKQQNPSLVKSNYYETYVNT